MAVMRYKNYFGSIEFDEEARLFYGKLLFLRALVSYEAKDADGLIAVFHDAVDDYLAHCAATDTVPEKPLKGSFNVRLGPELHRQVALAATATGQSLNAFVMQTLATAVQQETPHTAH